MADTKITALTAISTVDPAVDVLPIVDVSDTTMAASGTTKKITSNQILGAGGTATLASATITGDLTVDTNSLKVDTANNRVGILTSTPGFPLHVNGTDSNNVLFNGVSKGIRFSASASTSSISGVDNTGSLSYQPLTIEASTLNFALSGSTAMTLNSTGLAVGTTAQYARFTATGINSTGIANIQNSPFASNANTNLSCYIGHDGTANRPFIQAATGNAGSAFDLLIQPYGGNVGVGTALSGGSISNTAKILAGIFSTLIGNTGSIATATPTTMFAAPSESTLMVTAYITGSAAPANYNAVSIVKVSSGTAAITAISTALNLTITLSGANVQVTQTSGVNQTIQFNVLRLA